MCQGPPTSGQNHAPPPRRGAVSSLEPAQGEGEQGGWGPGLCVQMQVPRDVWDSLQRGTPRDSPSLEEPTPCNPVLTTRPTDLFIQTRPPGGVKSAPFTIPEHQLQPRLSGQMRTEGLPIPNYLLPENPASPPGPGPDFVAPSLPCMRAGHGVHRPSESAA